MSTIKADSGTQRVIGYCDDRTEYGLNIFKSNVCLMNWMKDIIQEGAWMMMERKKKYINKQKQKRFLYDFFNLRIFLRFNF